MVETFASEDNPGRHPGHIINHIIIMNIFNSYFTFSIPAISSRNRPELGVPVFVPASILLHPRDAPIEPPPGLFLLAGVMVEGRQEEPVGGVAALVQFHGFLKGGPWRTDGRPGGSGPRPGYSRSRPGAGSHSVARRARRRARAASDGVDVGAADQGPGQLVERADQGHREAVLGDFRIIDHRLGDREGAAECPFGLRPVRGTRQEAGVFVEGLDQVGTQPDPARDSGPRFPRRSRIA